MASGGNRGPDSFNFGLLAADHHYAATTAGGELADYSANNSMTTTAGRGDVNVMAMPISALDPTPLSEQQGTYRLAGSNVHFPSAEFGGFLEFTPLRNPHELPQSGLTAPNAESWTQGTEVMASSGTSFVNLFKLPEELRPTNEESDD